MNDRNKTMAALTIIIGFIVLVIVIVGAIIGRSKIVSPVPEEGSIKIIFSTPTPTIVPTIAITDTLTPTKKVTPKPTAKPTVIPTPTKISTPTPTP